MSVTYCTFYSFFLYNLANQSRLMRKCILFHGELGGEDRTIEFMRREGRASMKAPLLDNHGHERGIVKHPFPLKYILKPWKLGQWVYQVIKFGIVQYVSSIFLGNPSICSVNYFYSFILPCMTSLVDFHGR